MSERSTGGALAPSFCAMALASRFSAPAMKAGFAYETPFSLLQSLAMTPVYDAAIMTRKKITTTSETMPNMSWRRRLQARSHRPGDSWKGADGGFERTALI